MNGRIYGFLDFIVSLASEFRKCVLMLTHFLAMFPFTRPPPPSLLLKTPENIAEKMFSVSL